jgi:hypothetical protein
LNVSQAPAVRHAPVSGVSSEPQEAPGADRPGWSDGDESRSVREQGLARETPGLPQPEARRPLVQERQGHGQDMQRSLAGIHTALVRDGVAEAPAAHSRQPLVTDSRAAPDPAAARREVTARASTIPAKTASEPVGPAEPERLSLAMPFSWVQRAPEPVQRAETEPETSPAPMMAPPPAVAEEPRPINLDQLARQVYPILKRMLAADRERRYSR